jgi:hypothetical protein
MNYKSALKNLIYCDIAILTIGILTIFFPSENVETFNKYITDNMSTLSNYIIIGLGFINLILKPVSWYLLYKFKKVGRDIFLIACILSLIGEIFNAPFAMDGLFTFFYNAENIVAGAILMLTYYSPLSKDLN